MRKIVLIILNLEFPLRKKFELSIFTFDESITDQSFDNALQELRINQSFEKLFEDELMCLNESIRDGLVSYSPPKKIGDPSFEVMFEDELRYLDIHIMDDPIKMYDDDQLRSRSGKKSRMRLRKVMNKLERMNTKITKRLTSLICSSFFLVTSYSSSHLCFL